MAATTLNANPLREGLRRTSRAHPVCMVIFGGTGDLALRKLMPSIYELERTGTMPHEYSIIAFAHTERTDDAYRSSTKAGLDEHLPGSTDEQVWKRLFDRMHYVASDFDSDTGYSELVGLIEKLNGEMGLEGNVLFYLAVPPSFYPDIVNELRKSGLAKSSDRLPGWRRIVVEKPFGHDLKSARQLNEQLADTFDETEIYRVDHYLGKETVQNILVFRAANAIFEPVWNRHFVDHVEITAAEDVGLEGRSDYYEEAGALRDMVQSHGLHLAALVGMELPVSLRADDIRNETVKLMRSIRRVAPTEVSSYAVRGQYGPGLVGGEPVPGYRQEEGVRPDSSTETYVALRLCIDNWRWHDVPFYIRTGKRLARKKTEIAISFSGVPPALFGSGASVHPTPNAMVLRIQPNEGVAVQIGMKSPGAGEIPRPVNLDFQYLEGFGSMPSDAYQRLIADILIGDQTLFARRDAVEEQWSVVTPILQGWELSPPAAFPNYPAGSFGPQCARELLERDGRRWRRL